MDEENTASFIERAKALIPTGQGDVPEYLFSLVELISEAEKAIKESNDKAILAERTINENQDKIAQLEEENRRLRDINVQALLNTSSKTLNTVESNEDEEEEKKIKSIEEIKKEGVEL